MSAATFRQVTLLLMGQCVSSDVLSINISTIVSIDTNFLSTQSVSLLLSQSINVFYCCLNQFISLIIFITQCNFLFSQSMYLSYSINQLISLHIVYFFRPYLLLFNSAIFLCHIMSLPLSLRLLSPFTYIVVSRLHPGMLLSFFLSRFTFLTLLSPPLYTFWGMFGFLVLTGHLVFGKHPLFSVKWDLQLMGW